MPTKYPFTNDEFKALYSKVPRLCADIIILTEQGVLLLERDIPPHNGFWHIPGGTIYYQEPMEAAIKRIAKNEIGVDVEPGELLGYVEYPSEVAERGWGWSVSLEFSCTIVSGTPQAAEQGTAVGFFLDIPEKTVPEQKAFLLNVMKKIK
jgi:ADP-ribose pyrophosphatase YjhB (NUDIX family)